MTAESGVFGISSQRVRDGDIGVFLPRDLNPILLKKDEEDAVRQPETYKLARTTSVDELCKSDFEDIVAAYEIWRSS